MSRVSTICLITPGHVASTPRLVKEADALCEAGYRVHVVSGRNFPDADPLDAEVLARAKWECTRIDCLGPGALLRRVMRQLARRMVPHGPFGTLGMAIRAVNPIAFNLAGAASRVSADLYIGHGVPGLAAAARAAATSGSKYGFDAEDFHDAESDFVIGDLAEGRSVRKIQSSLLQGCAHLTASSPMISRRYAEDYGAEPITILNVFPRSLGPAVFPARPAASDSRPAVAYWFSQTVGPGRGLEESILALARMKTPVELHVRGFPSPGYAEQLRAAGLKAGLKRPVVFLPPGAPDEMARLASAADIGLSTEARLPPNRNLCLTNKVFTYILAGIPQLLSGTDAQASLAPELGKAAILSDISDPARMAADLDALLGDADRTAAARAHARSIAASRFCWEVESRPFIESVMRAAPLG